MVVDHGLSTMPSGSLASRGLPARSRGAALLVFMLVMLMVVSGVLIERLSARAALANKRSAEATQALAAAKAALIAYAVQDDNRPGELPCPDFDYDGGLAFSPPAPSISDYSGSNCRSRLGWFPYRAVDTPELLDDSGARLWYAVSDVYRTNSGVALNSETPGTLDLDGTTDVVAVIIAPGEALDTQARPVQSVPLDAVADRGQYLENVNADGNLDTYVSTPGSDFNDRVMIITRAELMREVEKRVVGEVLGSLKTFHAAHGVFPWPVAYSNPRDLDQFSGSPGVVAAPDRSEGLVPMHGKTGSSVPELSFITGLVVEWAGLTDATLTDLPSVSNLPSPGTPVPYPPVDAISDAELRDGPAGGIFVGATGGVCRWDEVDRLAKLDCDDVEVTFTLPSGSGQPYERYFRTNPSGNFSVNNWNRKYSFSNLDYLAALVDTAIVAPTATRTRMRSITKPVGTAPIGMLGPITITDTIEFINGSAQVETATLARTVSSPATTGSMTVSVNYYLDPETELPPWFIDNDWHQLIYYAVAVDYVGGGDGDCLLPAPSTCLQLEVDGPPPPSNPSVVVASDVGIAVLSAGAALTTQTRGTGVIGLAQYLEDSSVASAPFRVTNMVSYRPRGDVLSNDYVRVLRRGELP